MKEKKNSLLLTNVHVLYVAEDKTSKKNFRLSACLPVCLSVFLYVCPSVCLSVCLSLRTWTFHVDTITFEGDSGSKHNLVGVFYVLVILNQLNLYWISLIQFNLIFYICPTFDWKCTCKAILKQIIYEWKNSSKCIQKGMEWKWW